MMIISDNIATWKDADEMEECISCRDDLFPMKNLGVLSCPEKDCKEYMCKDCAICEDEHHWETRFELPQEYREAKPTLEEALAETYCDRCKEVFTLEKLEEGFRHCEARSFDICADCIPVTRKKD